MISAHESKTLLIIYRYDPLDRLVDLTPSTLARTQRFYLSKRLVTEVQGAEHCCIFQQGEHLLAQQQSSSKAGTHLLVADQQRSVLNTPGDLHPSPYTPYGYRRAEVGMSSVLEFNGERCDPVTRHYLLGNGYRAFNPVLMRFNSPDSYSPFEEGGLNPYAYCLGNPVNFSDPSGHFVTTLLAALSTKVATLSGAAVSIVAGVTAQAMGLSRLWVHTAGASGMISAALIPAVFRPTTALALQQIARPVALSMLAAGTAVAVRALAPLAMNVARNTGHIVRGLGREALRSETATAVMRTPIARLWMSHSRGFDLPVHNAPTRSAQIIRTR